MSRRGASAVRAGYTGVMIELARYPQLRLIAWQRDRTTRLDGREALALYESNWRFVDPQQLTPAETRLIRRLAKRYGHGVLNV